MGFTMVLDILIERYDLYTALVFGKISRYEQMKDKKCSASYQKMADELGISKKTVQRTVKKLLDENLIIDVSPNANNVKGITRQYVTNQAKLKSLNTVDSQSMVSIDTMDSQSVTVDSQSITVDSESIKETIRNNKHTIDSPAKRYRKTSEKPENLIQ